MGQLSKIHQKANKIKQMYRAHETISTPQQKSKEQALKQSMPPSFKGKQIRFNLAKDRKHREEEARKYAQTQRCHMPTYPYQFNPQAPWSLPNS